ncbi:dihydrolipoyl dehydrogenase, partial [Candidatus Micrarchaeota archaeon]|nr:dihydrolipoyl dehydrogenase [Candidatus Micrarchaeota archaeon]
VGMGSGAIVADEALNRNWKVAIVEEGPFGGTCLNRGCIPSKMLIHSADVVETVRTSETFGIKSRIERIDFQRIVKRVTSTIDSWAAEGEERYKKNPNVEIFKERGRFIENKVMQIGDKEISGKKIVIAAGSRPAVPPIKGIEKVPYVTSDQALRLSKQPEELTIIGGGYISAELAHFFGSLGTRINIIQRGSLLIPNEDKELAKTFTEIFKKRYNVVLEHNTESVSYEKGRFSVVAAGNDGSRKTFVSDQLLVATGRVPNSDLLDVEKTGVEVNERGFIKVNEYMETTSLGIWALGDIAGKFLLKHAANLEAEYVAKNMAGKRIAVDYTAMPNAIFSSPQVAAVGMTEDDLIEKKIPYAKGYYKYNDTAMGTAIEDNVGYVKVLADPKTKRILGCHIIGSDASTLIHEVIVAMKYANSVESVLESVHVHPALSEVVQMAFYSIKW